MDRQAQIGLLERLLHHVDGATTHLADAPWRNDVSVYTDATHLAREQAILFRQHPLLMGFASEWPGPGAFRTDDFAGVPILVARARDGKLRAFLNVCRHRGAKVAQGCGKARVFSCPYHAWTYDLSGKVIGIPDERCFPGVRAERGSLTELPLCEKHGLVWVIPTPTADASAGFDIDPWLGGLGPELASFGFGGWSFYDKRVIPESMNWKILVDTFHEGYHIGFLHKESLIFDPARQRDRLRGIRPQSPSHHAAQEARTAQGGAGGDLGPDVEYDDHLLAVPQYDPGSARRPRRGHTDVFGR